MSRRRNDRNVVPAKSNATKRCSKSCGFCAANSPTNAMCPPTSFFPMLRCAKWHALIRRQRSSSVEFRALVSKSCAILRNRLRQQSRNILRKDPGSLRKPSKPDQLLFFSFHAARQPAREVDARQQSRAERLRVPLDAGELAREEEPVVVPRGERRAQAGRAV